MRMVDIIEKKRDGKELSTEEIQFFVKGYTEGTIPDYQAASLLMAIYFQDMTERERTDLTMAMVESGDTIDLSPIQGIKCDKHSTGGVGEAMTTNNIKEKNEYTFYSHLNSYIEIVHNAIRENVLKFIFYKKPTLPKSIKKFAEKTGISEHTYRLYKSKMITPSYKMMMHIFDITESNEKEFTKYLNKQAKINVSSDFLMESLLFQKDVRKKYLFSRKIKCGNCNTNYLARRKNHSHDVYYVCNSINKEYCGNYKIEELTILKAINKHTNLTFDEELIKNHIDNITVFNNGDFTVYFKEEFPYDVLNVKSKETVTQ